MSLFERVVELVAPHELDERQRVEITLDPKSRSWPLNSAFDSARLQFQVASAWFQTRRSAQGTAFEEGLEGSREDFPPSMQRRQLLRSFNQATKELGDGPSARRREPSGRACWRFG